jgi:hypothetical protein
MDDSMYESDPLAGTSDTYHGRFCGYPGLVWYATVRKVKGADLRVGDWLDTLDHRGARAIYGIFAGAAPADTDMVDVEHLCRLTGRDLDSGLLTVMVAGGETETIRVDVEYDVVDPDSQVTPTGEPVTGV